MGHMSQEHKKELSPAIKSVLSKYGMKGTISVRHHSTLVVNIKSGKLDIIGNWWNHVLSRRERGTEDFLGNTQPTHLDVNEYWLDEHYTGEVLDFLKELLQAMKGDKFFNHDDIQSDYFHRSHYTDINVGQWNKPYILEA